MSKAMKRLLLISNSTQHGTGYLEHCEAEVKSFFAGKQDILFVPYALADHDGYAATAKAAFEKMGFTMRSAHEVDDLPAAVAEVGGVFIGGGNTFRLLKALYEKGLVESIGARVAAGMPYMGTSAGSNMACPTVRTTNDMPIVYPPSFDALNLVPFQINPHYLDPAPDSTHMGETRETRLREYHEENDMNIVGLREGGILHVEGDTMTLEGGSAVRLFRKGQDPVEYPVGSNLSFLL